MNELKSFNDDDLEKLKENIGNVLESIKELILSVDVQELKKAFDKILEQGDNNDIQ